MSECSFCRGLACWRWRFHGRHRQQAGSYRGEVSPTFWTVPPIRRSRLAGDGDFTGAIASKPAPTGANIAEMAVVEPSPRKCCLGRGMTMHQCCAILRAALAVKIPTKSQVMHLQKPRFCREFSLNIVGCRVKYPAGSFLDCTSR